jgi:Flp pilus assembly protein TadD
MRSWSISLLCLLLASCATTRGTPGTEALFNDQLFSAPSERISASDVFALSDDMERFLRAEIAGSLRRDSRDSLIEAVYIKGQLKLDYDSAITRNAAQAFAARSGNCLSLAIMTGAFAKALGLPVQFQSVDVEETVSRSDDILFYVGHVNLTLGLRPNFFRLSGAPDLKMVDFLPPQDMRGLLTRPIAEQTVIAMYMNNRAVEAFARGEVNDAYWWARAAVHEDPDFVSAYNTLGIIFWRHGNAVEAEKVLSYALRREPQNTHVMANLIRVFNDLGRVADAKNLTRKLEQLEPVPPFADFEQGRQAMRDGNYKAAKDLFAKEVARAPFDHELHFWLASAYAGLGDIEQARRQLTLAMEYSATGRAHDLYAAKLARITSSQLH